MSNTTVDEGPWYKQFWLWFILVPLFVVMILGFTLLYVSIVTSDGVVVDNYYRDGKGYAVRYEEDAFARAANLAADVAWSGSDIKLQLSGDLSPLPDTLELIVIFPTAQKYDEYVVLKHRGLGQYTAQSVPTDLSGRRFLQLHPMEGDVDWRLHAEVMFPIEQTAELLPKQE